MRDRFPCAFALLLCGTACDFSEPRIFDGGASSADGGTDAGLADVGILPERVGTMSESMLVELLADNQAGAASTSIQLSADKTGFGGLIPLAGDFDGDGEVDLGFFDPRRSEFVLSESSRGLGAPPLRFVFGGRSVLPIVGDWDGDRRATVGVYDPATGTFELKNSNAAGAPDQSFEFGPIGHGYPVAGDFEGSGVDQVGVYDTATNRFTLPGGISFRFGTAGDFLIPLAGDFDGDGRSTVGLYDLLRQTFYLLNANQEGPPDLTLPLPLADYLRLPIAGRWPAVRTSSEAELLAWPTADPLDSGVIPALLESAIARASAQQDLYSLLIVRHGKLVSESYFHGAARAQLHNVKSVSKSILSALTGIALAEGKIRADQTLGDLLGSVVPSDDPRKRAISLVELMTMTAGFVWNDDASVVAMAATDDWVGYILSQPLSDAPGTRFTYNTGLTHLMSTILTQKTGQSIRAYAETKLFGPLGIRRLRWDRDIAGTPVGGAELYLTARDLAAFGQLYLGRGIWNGRTLVEPSWVDASSRGTGSYGAWWWIGSTAGAAFAEARGYGGQEIFVIPDDDLVVVMTSNSEVDGAASTRNLAACRDLLDRFVMPAIAR
jgi:CubicO group peptidase (beta-lactamase class C family)